MFKDLREIFLLFFLMANAFVIPTFAQKNKLGFSLQYQQNTLENGNTYELKYELPDVVYYGLVYERDWDKIFCDMSVNFSTLKFRYKWSYEFSHYNISSREDYTSITSRTEEIFRGKFNFIGLNLIMGAKCFQTDNDAFKFYFYGGIALDYPIYMHGNYTFKIANNYSENYPLYYRYNYSYSDTIIYWNSSFGFKETLLASFPMGVRYRFSILKKLYFDFNMGFRPQLNNLSGSEDYSFKNGFCFGSLLTIPIRKKNLKVPE